MHIGVELLIACPPIKIVLSTTCDAGIRIIEYAYRIYRCISFDTLCGFYGIIRHGIVESIVMVWLSISKEYNNLFCIFTWI